MQCAVTVHVYSLAGSSNAMLNWNAFRRLVHYTCVPVSLVFTNCSSPMMATVNSVLERAVLSGHYWLDIMPVSRKEEAGQGFRV